MSKQDKITRTDISISGNTATFSIGHQGLLQGTYIGQFVFKCFLLPFESLAAARDKRELLGELQDYATPDEKFLAFALSELKYRIISSPPFWNQGTGAGNIPDKDVLLVVINAAMDSEALYAQQKREEKEKTMEAALKAAEIAVARQKAEAEKETKEKTEEELLDEELDKLDE